MSSVLRQIRMNALSAKFLHTLSLKKLSPQKKLFNGISIILPILITGVLYLSKGTDFQFASEVISFILSTLLIGYGVYYLISEIDERMHIHRIYAKKNIDVANEALRLLQTSNLSQDVIDWFAKYVNELDQQDNESLKDITKEEERESYREALKQFEPGNVNVNCENCKKSPWNYVPGNCQLCGNVME